MSEQNGNGTARPTVAVIGGGYGGVGVARALDEELDVVLVDPKEAFGHTVGALRALVDTSWLPRVFFPLERLLARGRFVRDRAVEVEPGRVVLASGEELRPDYVVLATGSSYPFPAKSAETGLEATFARYRQAHDALAAADRVLLMGAGPVGLELAGEIVSAWPEKQVTIVDVADDVLRGPFDPALRTELRRQLAERGVRLVLGSGTIPEPPTAPGELGSFRVRTESGDELEGDVWYRAYGVVPQSGYLAGDLATARDAAGFVTVTDTLQVPGHDRVFVVGDVSDADAKMAGRAGMQAEVVADNIRTLVAGGDELRRYEPMPPVIVVPLGPEGGAGQLPGVDGIVGADVAADLKGRDLLTGKWAETFGMEPADAV